MAASISIETMTVSEKLEAMEALWESLSAEPSNVPSPSWHADVLAAREKEIQGGKCRVLDWDACKKMLRETCV